MISFTFKNPVFVLILILFFEQNICRAVGSNPQPSSTPTTTTTSQTTGGTRVITCPQNYTKTAQGECILNCTYGVDIDGSGVQSCKPAPSGNGCQFGQVLVNGKCVMPPPSPSQICPNLLGKSCVYDQKTQDFCTQTGEFNPEPTIDIPASNPVKLFMGNTTGMPVSVPVPTTVQFVNKLEHRVNNIMGIYGAVDGQCICANPVSDTSPGMWNTKNTEYFYFENQITVYLDDSLMVTDSTTEYKTNIVPANWGLTPGMHKITATSSPKDDIKKRPSVCSPPITRPIKTVFKEFKVFNVSTDRGVTLRYSASIKDYQALLDEAKTKINDSAGGQALLVATVKNTADIIKGIADGMKGKAFSDKVNSFLQKIKIKGQTIDKFGDAIGCFNNAMSTVLSITVEQFNKYQDDNEKNPESEDKTITEKIKALAGTPKAMDYIKIATSCMKALIEKQNKTLGKDDAAFNDTFKLLADMTMAHATGIDMVLKLQEDILDIPQKIKDFYNRGLKLGEVAGNLLSPLETRENFPKASFWLTPTPKSGFQVSMIPGSVIFAEPKDRTFGCSQLFTVKDTSHINRASLAKEFTVTGLGNLGGAFYDFKISDSFGSFTLPQGKIKFQTEGLNARELIRTSYALLPLLNKYAKDYTISAVNLAEDFKSITGFFDAILSTYGDVVKGMEDLKKFEVKHENIFGKVKPGDKTFKLDEAVSRIKSYQKLITAVGSQSITLGAYLSRTLMIITNLHDAILMGFPDGDSRPCP